MPDGADAGPLLLIGAPDAVLDLAAGLARAPRTRLSVGYSAPDLLRLYRRRRPHLVAVDLTLDLPEVVARLREPRRPGHAGATDPIAAFVGRPLADIERALILATLARCHGNRTRAAAMLGVSVRTLRNRLHQFEHDGATHRIGADG
ncbi:helix-turn-helix domain-containing protein [Sphingomonas sp. RIT328]|uniref:helix-turn-helix domain-containing protein n=1 Tax=Sphingomonas sp. RIT328 TaxID=1470591 RepID=UPI0004521BEC|nr:helix-turn-helix domain-containing protein [Sphingomonas sp. RIT328]EZP48665.1 Flagellar transcriptional regulator [Sphingomonas sp. RIT328]